MRRRFPVLICLAVAAFQPAPPKWGEWSRWGDQHNGTYRNPVLPADFSDLDCIRAGSDYFAISSTMQFSPGMVVLKSRDLVNWTIAGHVVADLTQIGPELNWDRMNRYGRGVWAGAIRFHNGKFYVYFGAPDEGYFMSTATDPAGPWTPVRQVLKGPGWDDPCPFWDDDGQGYLVGSAFKDGYKIHLWKLTPDGGAVIEESDRIIHQSRGSEANKLYKIDGLYYHLYSEARAEGRVVMMERSKSIEGPYREIRQLNYPDKEAKEPNQGGLIQTPQGAWYWFTHHGTGDWEGRAASLVPVTWLDGWPIPGVPDGKGIGHFVWGGRIPGATGTSTKPPNSDEFNEATLPPQWEWNYQPQAGKWSLKERPGWLRLHAFRPLEPGNLLKAGNTLTQRSIRTTSAAVIVKIDLSGMADGQRTGLCHFSKDSSSLGVRQEAGQRTLEFRHGAKSTPGPEVNSKNLWLKSSWGLDGRSRYAFSTDGRVFTEFGDAYQLSWGYYRGDRVALFSFNDSQEAGYADVDFFRYTLGR